KLQLAQALREDWEWAWEEHQTPGGYSPDPVSTGRRALAGLALTMLCLDAKARGDSVWPGRAYQRFKDAGNMTDRLAALSALVECDSELAPPAITRMHELFAGDELVIDKWFALQARAPEPVGHGAGRGLQRVKALMQHPEFSMKNPNRARSLVFTFAMQNPA